MPTPDRADYQWADASGATSIDTAPDRWDVLKAAGEAMGDKSLPPGVQHAAASSYSNLTVLAGLSPLWSVHTHNPIASTGDPEAATPWCCGDPMWAGPDGWVCRVAKTPFPYTDNTLEPLSMTTDTPAPADPCTHPIEARSTLQDGHAQFCTACQTRLDAPAAPAVTYEPPARMWGDEPDPLPAAPTILVASTDPYVNADGDAAREYAPKPALEAAKAALAGGWRYGFTYAAASVAQRGEPGKRGYKPAHVLHTIALRLARDTDVEGVLVHERGYAIWAREDAVTAPVVEGKWAWGSASIAGRDYGARELRARLLRHAREVLAEPAEPEVPAPAASTPVPVAPVVPGSWGSLHVGDTVTGGDARPYVVQTIARTGEWLGAGQPEVKVTLLPPDELTPPHYGEPFTVRKSAIEPAVIAERSESHEAAAILAAAFNVIEETTVTDPAPDLFSDPAERAAPGSTGLRAEAPFGKYRWYKLPHPITGDTEAVWPRVSTIVKTHADTDGLTAWEIRMAMKGLAVSPDLIAMVASLDLDTDKGKFKEAADQAHARAATKSGANFGTAIDRFSERLDNGESLAAMGVPTDLRPEIEAYSRTLREHGYEVVPELSQRTTLNVDHEYAGTWDRVVRKIATGDLFMLDVKRTKPDPKTGRMHPYSFLEYVSQVAAYVNGTHMCSLDFTGYEPMPALNMNMGLILHIIPGTGRAELYGVRLAPGWRNFTRSIETRKDRSEARTGWAILIERPRVEAVPAVPVVAVPAVPVVVVPAVPATFPQHIDTSGQGHYAPPVAEPAMPATVEPVNVHDLVARDVAAADTHEQLGAVFHNAAEAGVWTAELATLALGRGDQIAARTAADTAALGGLWAALSPAGRWTPEVQAHADARSAELAQLVSV